MLRKSFIRVFVFVLVLSAILIIPMNARAGGSICGTYYVVQAGETLQTIAANCGVSVDVLIAGNAGLGNSVYPGQVLVIPGTETDYGWTPTPNPQNSTYIVQYGDTFAEIAYRFGVSMEALAAANPQVWNINWIFAGQALNIPASTGSVPAYSWPWATPAPGSWYGYNYPPSSGSWWYVNPPTPTPEPSVPLSYGSAPRGTPEASITLSNKSNAQVYVSLQGTTRDDTSIIDEYPVGKILKVKEPIGWYVYVAYVGGKEFTGTFNLTNGADLTITCYGDKVVVN